MNLHLQQYMTLAAMKPVVDTDKTGSRPAIDLTLKFGLPADEAFRSFLGVEPLELWDEDGAPIVECEIRLPKLSWTHHRIAITLDRDTPPAVFGDEVALTKLALTPTGGRHVDCVLHAHWHASSADVALLYRAQQDSVAVTIDCEQQELPLE